jgi:hypothetical protein
VLGTAGTAYWFGSTLTGEFAARGTADPATVTITAAVLPAPIPSAQQITDATLDEAKGEHDGFLTTLATETTAEASRVAAVAANTTAEAARVAAVAANTAAVVLKAILLGTTSVNTTNPAAPVVTFYDPGANTVRVIVTYSSTDGERTAVTVN